MSLWQASEIARPVSMQRDIGARVNDDRLPRGRDVPGQGGCFSNSAFGQHQVRPPRKRSGIIPSMCPWRTNKIFVMAAIRIGTSTPSKVRLQVNGLAGQSNS